MALNCTFCTVALLSIYGRRRQAWNYWSSINFIQFVMVTYLVLYICNNFFITPNIFFRKSLSLDLPPTPLLFASITMKVKLFSCTDRWKDGIRNSITKAARPPDNWQMYLHDLNKHSFFEWCQFFCAQLMNRSGKKKYIFFFRRSIKAPRDARYL